MTVFFKASDGYIYGGESKESVMAAMVKEQCSVESEEMVELPGYTKMRVMSVNCEITDEIVTLEEEYAAPRYVCSEEQLVETYVI